MREQLDPQTPTHLVWQLDHMPQIMHNASLSNNKKYLSRLSSARIPAYHILSASALCFCHQTLFRTRPFSQHVQPTSTPKPQSPQNLTCCSIYHQLQTSAHMIRCHHLQTPPAISLGKRDQRPFDIPTTSEPPHLQPAVQFPHAQPADYVRTPNQQTASALPTSNRFPDF